MYVRKQAVAVIIAGLATVSSVLGAVGSAVAAETPVREAKGQAQTAPAPSTHVNASRPFTPFDLADWDRDGHQDIVARDNTTGNLWLYRGQSARGYSSYARVQIGNGW